MKKIRLLAGGTKRVVHVLASVLKSRLDGGPKAPMVGVRNWKTLDKVMEFWKVEILGPSTLLEIEEPLPGTNGRGICPLVTESPLLCWVVEPSEVEVVKVEGSKVVLL